MSRNLSVPLVLFGVVGFLLGLPALSFAQQAASHAESFIAFDVPGATSTDTAAIAVNAAGQITGTYNTDGIARHSFLRDRDGSFTSFDGPGSTFTEARAINSDGQIVGTYLTDGSMSHGFLRNPDGSFVTIDAPWAGSGNSLGTSARAINSRGQITGYYEDADRGFHGFVRDPDGTMISFEAPGIAGRLLGPIPYDINAAGQIVGTQVEGHSHGFLRNPDGTIIVFDFPGSSVYYTSAYGINPSGDIVGAYADFPSDISHGFVRDSDGTFVSFDAPGAGSSRPGQGTIFSAIKAAGEIAGYYVDADYGVHGFVRCRDGTMRSFDIPGAVDTWALGLNASGHIVGFYSDGASHGFVLRFKK
jgi:uncharacterized membrane protein